MPASNAPHDNAAAFDAIDWPRWRPTVRGVLCFIVREGGDGGDRRETVSTETRDDCADRENRDNREVLLILKKRGLGAGKINAPGGKIEPGESAEEAAIRETREEVGLTPRGLAAMGRLRFQFTDGLALHCTVFRADGCEGELVETPEAAPRWTLTSAIPYHEMWADDRDWLPLLLAGRRFEGDYLFDGERLLGRRVSDALAVQSARHTPSGAPAAVFVETRRAFCCNHTP